MKISHTMQPHFRAESARSMPRMSPMHRMPTPKQTLGWRWWLRSSFQAGIFLGLAALSATTAILVKEAKFVPALAAVNAYDLNTLAQTSPIPASAPAPARSAEAAPSPLSLQPFPAPQPDINLQSLAFETPAKAKSPQTDAAKPSTPAPRAAGLPGPAASEKVWPINTRWFNGRPVRPARTMTMTVTAYSPDWRSCGKWADGLTATLHSVYTNGHQLVAADPKLLPYGSLVTVPGYANDTIVPVLDCGGAIKGKRLDVLYPTHNVARRWGVQKLNVTIWEYADGKPRDNPRKLR